MNWQQTPDGLIINIKVIPKAKKNEIIGWEGKELKIRIAAVPDQGKANDELIRFLAKELGVRQSDCELLSGTTSRHKRILIKGDSAREALPP